MTDLEQKYNDSLKENAEISKQIKASGYNLRGITANANEEKVKTETLKLCQEINRGNHIALDEKSILRKSLHNPAFESKTLRTDVGVDGGFGVTSYSSASTANGIYSICSNASAL